MGVTVDPDDPVDSTTAILVYGMHASGTSLVSHLLSQVMRAPPGHAADANDKPLPRLIESGAVAGLNRRILEELGSSWSKPGGWFLRGTGIAESAAAIRRAIREHYLQSAIGCLSSATASSGQVILQDPSICLLHDLWDAALRELGRSVRNVHVFRNPLEVAAALKETHGLVQTRTLQLWVRYNLAALTALVQGHPLVVPYADVVDLDNGLLSYLATNLDLVAPSLGEEDMWVEWQRLIEPAKRETSIPDQVLVRSPLIPSIVKRLYALLTEFEARSREQRAAEVAELASAFEDHSLFAGNIVAVTLPEAPQLAAPLISENARGKRKLLIHYHLFKNAGTSVDAILRRNFGDGWINNEFPPQGQIDHQEAIRVFIRDNPHLAAISSHTLMLPVPEIDDIEILPILFVRHPLDRMKSAYEFERKQDATTTGTQIAKGHDFAGYVRARLAIPGDRACRDFHVNRLAMAEPGREGSERDRAFSALERLPFVGLVEAFKDFAERLQQLVQPMFPDFQSFDVKANVTARRQDSLAGRLAEIREELGEEFLVTVMAANEADMALYGKVGTIYFGKRDSV